MQNLSQRCGSDDRHAVEAVEELRQVADGADEVQSVVFQGENDQPGGVERRKDALGYGGGHVPGGSRLGERSGQPGYEGGALGSGALDSGALRLAQAPFGDIRDVEGESVGDGDQS